MALPTERHVHVSATNQRYAVRWGCPKREACVLLAQLADGAELLDLLALGNQSDDVAK